MRHTAVRLFNLALFTVGGCTPFSALPPSHFAETAEVVQRGDARVTLAAGGGGLGLDGHAIGGGARVRVGTGGGQEVGVEATALSTDTGGKRSAGAPWEGDNLVVAAKASWKAQFARFFAVVAGLGGAYGPTGPTGGGDLALLVSSAPRLLQVYGGARLSAAAPLGRDPVGPDGTTLALTAGAGLALRVTAEVQLIAEGGVLWGGNYATETNERTRWHEHAGGYGLGAVAFTFGH